MQQEDYIKRQIDQIGIMLEKLFSVLLGLRAKGRESEEILQVDNALSDTLNLNVDDLLAIAADKLIETLQGDIKLTNQNLEALAEILCLVADDADSDKNDNSRKAKMYERSLIIYEYVNKVSSTYSLERHQLIEKIKKAL